MQTDTKLLRRNDNGMFSLGRSAAEFSLCDWCGAENCTLRTTVESVSPDAIAPVTQCRIFIPVLSFSDVAGLDRSFWNTFRSGTAWSKRLQRGMKVGVYDLRQKILLKHATVEEVVTGKLSDLCNVHASLNHLALANNWTIEAAAQLQRLMRQFYGTAAASDSIATVIYLRA